MDYLPHIKKLYALLGAEAVLLPVPMGSKGPVQKGWQSVRFEETQTEDYQAQLAKGNVGVLLGEPSGGLCAIDIDDDQAVEPFLKLNPVLRSTLITRGARGVQIWIRCEVDSKRAELGVESFPKMYGLKFIDGYRDQVDPKNPENLRPGMFGEWRSTGGQSIIYGKHPSGVDYSFFNEAAVKCVRFYSLRWPAQVVSGWGDDVGDALVRRYGDPWVPDKSGEPTGMNESYYAGLFAYHHHVVYENDEERYYVYNTRRGVWERAKDEDVFVLASSMLLKASRAQGHPSISTMRFRSSSKMRNISTFLKGTVGDRAIFKRRRGLIHLQNGMIDLMAVDLKDPALRLLPFDPDYKSRNQIPVRFDPEAECPKFVNDLLLRGLAAENVKLMQRWSGLLLLQENVFQKMMILTGTAGSGKSTVLSVFQKMVGQDNCAQLRTEQLLERFEMAAFIGKSTLIGADVPGNFLMQRGAYKLKQLTGGDFFQAELKTARDFVSLKGDYNVGITCNSRLRVAMDSDAGAWDRRLLIIKYEAAPPEKKISNFDDWLIENEGSGILNWMIEGALEILHAGKFEMTDGQKSAVTDLLEESDSMRSFLRRCVVPGQRDCNVTTDELIEAYHGFCDSRGWDALPTGTLEKHLPNLMLELYRTNKSNSIKRDGTARRGYSKIKLIDLQDDASYFEGDVEL